MRKAHGNREDCEENVSRRWQRKFAKEEEALGDSYQEGESQEEQEEFKQRIQERVLEIKPLIKHTKRRWNQERRRSGRKEACQTREEQTRVA